MYLYPADETLEVNPRRQVMVTTGLAIALPTGMEAQMVGGQ